MSGILRSIWNWVLSWFDDSVVRGPIKIGAHVYMPLFYRSLTGGVAATWNYLSKSDPEKKHLRNHIKNNAASGETPAIAFCLTPSNINGGLVDDKMLAVGDWALDLLEAKCKELVADGIAVFPTLYVDDAAPRWFEIEKHKTIWARVHARIGKYVTGYILSIETNEYANNVGQITGCINVIRNIMPGVDFYGTHLQWMTGGGRYSWRGLSSLPPNANIILAEYTFDPNKGNAISDSAFRFQTQTITAANPGIKIVHHEFNVDSMGDRGKRQTGILREMGVWGVAAATDEEVET